VLEVLHQERYADLSVAQVWARELDEGRYHASQSTMYRILRQAGEVRERRRQATHPPRKRPELMADAPCQVWSWDITKLRGPGKGVWYTSSPTTANRRSATTTPASPAPPTSWT